MGLSGQTGIMGAELPQELLKRWFKKAKQNKLTCFLDPSWMFWRVLFARNVGDYFLPLPHPWAFLVFAGGIWTPMEECYPPCLLSYSLWLSVSPSVTTWRWCPTGYGFLKGKYKKQAQYRWLKFTLWRAGACPQCKNFRDVPFANRSKGATKAV